MKNLIPLIVIILMGSSAKTQTTLQPAARDSVEVQLWDASHVRGYFEDRTFTFHCNLGDVDVAWKDIQSATLLRKDQQVLLKNGDLLRGKTIDRTLNFVSEHGHHVIEVRNINTIRTINQPNAAAGTVVFYPFSGTTKDHYGSGADGQPSEAQFTTDRFDRANEAVRFSKAEDCISIPMDMEALGINNQQLTVSGWIQYNATPSANAGIFLFCDKPGVTNAVSKNIGVWMERDGMLHGRIIQENNASVNFPKIKRLAPNTWYHVAVVIDVDQNMARQYVNGEVVGVIPLKIGFKPFQYLVLGQQAKEYLSGDMDDVWVHNRALSSSEIQHFFQLGQIKLYNAR